MKITTAIILPLAAVVGLGAAVACGPETDSPGHQTVPEAAVKTEEAPEQTAPFSSFEDGTFKVGADIKAGTYKSDGKTNSISDFCYWARSTDDSGEISSIIANSFAEGPGRVTVKPGEYLTTSGGCTWRLVAP